MGFMEGEKEARRMEKCESGAESDRKCKRQRCSTEAEENEEHYVKLQNTKTSKATHSYRHMRLKTENEKLHASVL